MTDVRAFVVLTLLAAALGGVAGAAFVALRAPVEEPPRPRAPDSPGAPDLSGTATPRRTRRPAPESAGPSSVPAAATSASLSERLSAPDEDVRNAVALELLRRGPDALAQARALVATTREAEDLQLHLVAALRKMKLLRQAQGYADLAEHIRRRLDLDAFRSVVPESLLVEDRIAYWQLELDAVKHRLEGGYAEPGEEALAELELARARTEAGTLTAQEYADLWSRRGAAAEGYVDGQRGRRDVSPAAFRELADQIARLRP